MDNIDTVSPVSRPTWGGLKGRAAVVTASTRGIDAGIAASLAEAGCDMILNGLKAQTEGAALAQGLAEAAFAEDSYGRVDILVNNAGAHHVCIVEDFPDERCDEVLSLSLSDAFLCGDAARTMAGAAITMDGGRVVA